LRHILQEAMSLLAIVALASKTWPEQPLEWNTAAALLLTLWVVFQLLPERADSLNS